MSIGPRKILSYRADRPPSIRIKAKKASPKRDPMRPDRAKLDKKSANKAQQAHRVPLEEIRVSHKLVLRESQRAQIESLFKAPRALAALLVSYPEKICSDADARLFLLKNKKALDTYINADGRSSSVDLLAALIVQWSIQVPDSLGIDFDDVSLTPENKVYLPLQGLFGVEVVEAPTLEQQRKRTAIPPLKGLV